MPRHALVIAIATGLAALVAGPAGCRRSSSRQTEAHVVRRPPQRMPRSSPSTGIRRAPPEDDGDPRLLPLVQRALEGYDGPVAYLGEREEGDRRFGDLESRIVRVDPDAFAGRSSREALAALEAARARFLLVSTLDPPIRPWPSDEDTTIHVLLRDGVPPPRFQPVAIGRAHALYRIGEPASVTEAQMASITSYLRDRLAGRRSEGEPDLPGDEPFRGVDGRVRAVVAVRPFVGRCRGGRTLGQAVGSGRTVREALDDAARQLGRDWRGMRGRSPCEDAHPAGMGDALATLTLQVELVHRMAAISDRAPDRLYYLVELGREGVWLRRGSSLWLVTPARTIHEAIDDEAALVDRLARWNDQPAEAWQDERYEVGRLETLAWVELEPGQARAIRALHRGVPLIRMADVTRDSVVDGLFEGARYLVHNQTSAGEYRYLYRPLRPNARDRWTRDNNIVRHSLCPLVVIRANRLRPDPTFLPSARRGIDYTLSFLRRTGDRCHVWHQDEGTREGNAKMGTVAATVISIIELGRAGGDISDLQDELDCLANQILAMLGDDGVFVHYDVPAGHPFHGSHNTIFPGELMLALSRLHEHTGEARYREAFDRAMEHQRSWFRETMADPAEDGVYDERRRVDLISFEPWGIMAVEDMGRQHPDDRRYADFAFELVDFVDSTFQSDLERSQYADYLGSYFKTQQELPAINSCGYTEGAAAAFAVALRTGEHVDERRRSLVTGVRFVLQLQYHPDRSLFYALDPESTSGGFRYNLSFSRVRNDYMYHAMNALALAAMSLRPEDYPAQAGFGEVPEILEPAFEGLQTGPLARE